MVTKLATANIIPTRREGVLEYSTRALVRMIRRSGIIWGSNQLPVPTYNTYVQHRITENKCNRNTYNIQT
jgi:hypothetical protein